MGTVPAVGKPTFEIGPDEMEMSVGIHRELGRRRVKLAPAAIIAEEIVGAIHKDLAKPHKTPCLLLINGFGGTPLMELYLMCEAARRVLAGRGLTVARSLVASVPILKFLCT